MAKLVSAVVGGVGLAVAMMVQGCVVQQSADDYREPIPASDDVSLKIPGSATAKSGTSAQSLRIQGNPGSGTAGTAKFYQFTRDISDGVDWGAIAVIGLVELIVSFPPTTVDAHKATWGPSNGGNALDPVVWRMTVTAVGDHEYDYVLEGRPHTSQSEGDFLAILTGHGYGKSRAEHRSGWFLIDNDASRQLDPARNHDNGTIKVTFDARTFPITIEADVKHTADPSWFDVNVSHNQDTSGGVQIHALGDIDTPKDGSNENVVMNSRWNSTGAGRADVSISGGNFNGGVTLSECWDATFARDYYTDSVNYQPTSGSASACAFPVGTF